MSKTRGLAASELADEIRASRDRPGVGDNLVMKLATRRARDDG